MRSSSFASPEAKATRDMAVWNRASCRPTLSEVTTSLLHRHKARESCQAEQLFQQRRYKECAQRCHEILREGAAEAIEALAHVYLSTLLVGPRNALQRASHARKAVEAWEAVINRTGVSRYPVAEARAQLETIREHCEETIAFAEEVELAQEVGGSEGLS